MVSWGSLLTTQVHHYQDYVASTAHIMKKLIKIAFLKFYVRLKNVKKIKHFFHFLKLEVNLKILGTIFI